MSHIFGIVEQFPYLGIFILLFLGAIGFPLPEDTTLILCGFLIADEVIKPVPALLVVYGSLLGLDYALFFIGRKYGREIVTHKKFRRFISEERLSALEEKFNKWGILFIVFGRHLAVLRTQIFLSAGAVRMSPYKFFVADAVSSPFTMLLMIGIGYLGGSSLLVLKKDITRIEHVLILIIIAAVVIYLLYRSIQNRRSSSR